jgi:hypothetical protein
VQDVKRGLEHSWACFKNPAASKKLIKLFTEIIVEDYKKHFFVRLCPFPDFLAMKMKLNLIPLLPRVWTAVIRTLGILVSLYLFVCSLTFLVPIL